MFIIILLEICLTRLFPWYDRNMIFFYWLQEDCVSRWALVGLVRGTDVFVLRFILFFFKSEIFNESYQESTTAVTFKKKRQKIGQSTAFLSWNLKLVYNFVCGLRNSIAMIDIGLLGKFMLYR